jgi:4-carboxymuconolactone decarboxylase
MSRLAMVEPQNEPAELNPVFDQLRATRGRVPGMYRTLAHQPGVLAAHRAYFHAALDTGVLPRPFKEKIAFKVARLRQTPYCTGSHRSYALKHGVSPNELEAIDRGDYAVLSARERAALRFAEAMVAERGRVSDAAFMELNAHFSGNEIVEIVALIGIMELACSLAQVFELEPD